MTDTTKFTGEYAWANGAPSNGIEIEPQPRQADSGMVSARTATDLASSVRALAAAVGQEGLDRPERLARAELLSDSVSHLRDAAPWLSPYADGRGSRLADEATHHNVKKSAKVRADAAERIAQDRQARAVAQAQLTALTGYGTVHPDGVSTPASTGLLALAAPAGALGPDRLSIIPTVDTLPKAHVDPTTEMDYLTFTVNSTQAGWHTAAFPMNIAHQLADWSPTAQAALEKLVSVSIDAALEGALLAALTTGAPTATGLDAAEAAALTAWPSGTAVVIHAPADAPKVRTAYAGIAVESMPTLVPSAGATAGTVIVAARDGLFLEASQLDYMAQDEPSLLGKSIALYRYGRAAVRAAGAVQVVRMS